MLLNHNDGKSKNLCTQFNHQQFIVQKLFKISEGSWFGNADVPRGNLDWHEAVIGWHPIEPSSRIARKNKKKFFHHLRRDDGKKPRSFPSQLASNGGMTMNSCKQKIPSTAKSLPFVESKNAFEKFCDPKSKSWSSTTLPLAKKCYYNAETKKSDQHANYHRLLLSHHLSLLDPARTSICEKKSLNNHKILYEKKNHLQHLPFLQKNFHDKNPWNSSMYIKLNFCNNNNRTIPKPTQKERFSSHRNNYTNLRRHKLLHLPFSNHL